MQQYWLINETKRGHSIMRAPAIEALQVKRCYYVYKPAATDAENKGKI